MGRPVDEYRLRLEGRAELLEAARERYRKLVEWLGARAWEERARKELGLLREALEAQARVEETLASALRRAQAESWPALSPAVQLLRDVQALRQKLAKSLAQRLTRREEEPLAELLKALEERILTTPREVPATQRAATALELLPETLPTVKELAAFGRLLESLFAREVDPEEALSWSVEEGETLRREWARGEAALAGAWSRLARVDRTGGLAGELRKRAEWAPTHPPRTGPEVLLHAEYWRAAGRKRLEALVRTQFFPLVPSEAERLELACWLSARQSNPEARLAASATVSDARAGLLELAHELWRALRPDLAEEGRRLEDEEWERLKARANRAEKLPQGLEANRVRDVLRTFIRRRTMGTMVARGWQELPHSLEALVEQAWSMDR
jgi:hypothetical protein